MFMVMEEHFTKCTAVGLNDEFNSKPKTIVTGLKKYKQASVVVPPLLDISIVLSLCA